MSVRRASPSACVVHGSRFILAMRRRGRPWSRCVRTKQPPILVEGPRDVAALRALGLDGPFEVVNRGWDVARRIAHLVENHGTRGVDGGPALHLLMDWDRTGGRLQTTFRRRLEAFDVKVDEDVRRVLMRCLKPETRTVEGLSGLIDVLGMEGR